MLDMVTAMRVTQNCIREVGRLFPASENPIDPDDVLIDLRIDNVLIDRLVSKIANDNKIGLPSLIPPFRINQNIFQIDETSTVLDVFRTVFRNAVQA